MLRSSVAIIVPLVLATLALVGCGQRALGPVTPSAAEQALIERMTADPFVRIERLERDGQGNLLIITGQGDVTVRYLAVPPEGGGDRLLAQRLIDEPQLDVADDGRIGTGPEARGLGARDAR
ncbi:MAG TPA: hypothetical protein VEL07_03740 [Planctomycetota bacterium]|nr:hypothetical protein [Planctomycetota bacterium]